MAGVLAAIADPALRTAFREWLLQAADDELVIGHRHSEWTGVGPDIESDVALSSIAQEEIAHARSFYGQIAADGGDDIDALAFGRDAAAYRHAGLLEQENDGWEWSIVRLALYERYDAERLRLLGASGQEPVAGLARTLEREERYHSVYAEAWLTRLAGGSPEGHRRVQSALEAAWPEALGLFEGTDAEEALVDSGILRATPDIQRRAWEEAMAHLLGSCGLDVPSAAPRLGGRTGVHTPAFARMLAQMTEVWKSDPEARW